MLDHDLAALYGYEVKRLNEQVKRNIARFPDDFMFQLVMQLLYFMQQLFFYRKNTQTTHKHYILIL